MSFSDLSVCNRAIGKIGGDTLDEIGEETPLGVFCADNYGAFRGWLIGSYRWNFANRLVRLAQVTPPDGVVGPYPHAFEKPADLTGAVNDWRSQAEPDAYSRVDVRENDGLYWSSSQTVFAEYTRLVPEAEWPVWFENLVVIGFAADLALQAQRVTLARDLRTQAFGTPADDGKGGLYAAATQEDSRNAPQRVLTQAGVDPGPLVDTRASSWGFGWPRGFLS